MKVDLHLHTAHSFDCKTRVEDVIRTAEEAGLDAVAITDHDTLSGVELARGIARRLTVIPGVEISTWKGIHLLGLFLTEEINSRDIFEIIEEVHDQGGLVALPHPFRHSTGLIYGKEKHQLFNGEDFREILSCIDLVEVVNYGCTPEENMDTNSFFDAFPDIPQIAGSDAHQSENIGKAYVDLDIDKTDDLERIKKALLSSDRTIRYEAYNAAEVVEKRVTAVAPKSFFGGLKGTLKKLISRNQRRDNPGD